MASLAPLAVRLARCKANPNLPVQEAINMKAMELTLAHAEKKGSTDNLADTYRLVIEGWDVYEQRNGLIPLFALAFFFYQLSYCMDWRVHVFALVMNYLYYDWFSGVLHVVLDEPKNLRGWRSKVLLKPCLEFQWHHAIPMDIVKKGILQACGDLNSVVLACMFLYCYCYDLLSSDVGKCLCSYRILFAYFGQQAHLCSHQVPSKNHWVVRKLQSCLMLSPDEHRGHHRTHDDNFCIGAGWFNPMIRAMRKVTVNPNVWFALFLSTFFWDLPLMQFVMRKVFD